jgi:hypothetical protein
MRIASSILAVFVIAQACLAEIPGLVTEPDVRDSPDVKLLHSEWRKGGFGVIGVCKITVKNNENRSVGNFRWHAEFYSESGILLNQADGTLMSVIGPHKTRTMEVNVGFIDPQAQRGGIELKSPSCEFVDAR